MIRWFLGALCFVLVVIGGMSWKPASAQVSVECFHADTAAPFGLLGDLNQSGAVNVADVVCGSLTVLSTLANPLAPLWPSCLSAQPLALDFDCNTNLTVDEVQRLTRIILGLGLPAAIDTLGRGCADACLVCDAPIAGQSACGGANSSAGGAVKLGEDGPAAFLPPGAVSEATVLRLERVVSPAVPGDFASDVIDLSPDGAVFDEPAVVCLPTNAAVATGSACLGYLDEAATPPAWKCEDHCLEQVSPSFWCGKTTHLTNFAILLGSGAQSNGDCGGDSRILGPLGGTVVASDGSAELHVAPGALRQPTNIRVVPSGPVPQGELHTAAYDFKPDGLRFAHPAALCLNAAEPPALSCLSYVDTSVNPPEWKCQDECLEQVSPSFWCGKTDHFTSFGILLGSGSGEPESCKTDERIVGPLGGSVESADGAAALHVAPGSLAVPVVIRVQPAENVPQGELHSGAYNFLPDGLKFDHPAALCFNIEEPPASSCLSYVDTSKSPPSWKCQDECLEQVSPSYYCGVTDHFTSFGVLLGSGSSSGGGCKTDERIIGAQGGTIVSAGGGAVLTIPTGALITPTLIAVKYLTAPTQEVNRASQVYRFGPAGLDFAQLATICLQTQGELPAGILHCLGSYSAWNSQATWRCEDSCLVPSNEGDGTIRYCGNTDHFTEFAILRGNDAVGGECLQP